MEQVVRTNYISKVFILFLVFALFCYALLGLKPETILFTNDIAVAFAVMQETLSGEIPLLGPASHLGGRHLGPSYFWFLSLLNLFVGSDPYIIVVCLSILKVISLVLLGYFVSKAFKRSLSEWIFIGFLISLLGSNHIEQLRVPWSANYILIPSALTICSCLYVIQKKSILSLLLYMVCAKLVSTNALRWNPFFHRYIFSFGSVPLLKENIL